MKILHLTVRKQWFDMILSGEKPEEYREMTDYWYKRLTTFFDAPLPYQYKHFDAISFRNGYGKDAPEMLVELNLICEGFARTEWSEGFTERCFILYLGEIISTKNLTNHPNNRS